MEPISIFIQEYLLLICITITLCLIGFTILLFLRDFLLSSDDLSDDEDYRYTDEIADSTTEFACDRLPIKMVELKDSDGLFPIGIKALFSVPDIKRQTKMAKKLKYVTNVSSFFVTASIDLGKRGMYKVRIDTYPTAHRTDSRYRNANPFIHAGDYRLCMGNSQSLYDKCYLNNDKLSCLRIIQEVLKCTDDSDSYRRWSQCK